MNLFKPSGPYAFLHGTSRRDFLIVQDLADPKLRPIKAISWHFVQNPEFARLELATHPAGFTTLTKYAERYGTLGHTFNLELKLGSEGCRIHRPVCTQSGSTYLVLEFLLNGLNIEFAKD